MGQAQNLALRVGPKARHGWRGYVSRSCALPKGALKARHQTTTVRSPRSTPRGIRYCWSPRLPLRAPRSTASSAPPSAESPGTSRTPSEQFSQNAVTSAQSTDSERSIVVSRFEDAEHAATTRRSLHNANDCYAVTYYVRRVNEVYESSTRVESVEWRLENESWRLLEDTVGLPDRLRKALRDAARDLPRPGDVARDGREITLPTDGTLYEAELAHCSSCEPMREEAMRIRLEGERLRARRACLEAELLALELERRRRAAAGDTAIELELGSWPLQPEAAPESPHD